MAFISEDRVDLLEEKLRSKVDTMTGFSDVEGKSRALEKVRGKNDYILERDYFPIVHPTYYQQREDNNSIEVVGGCEF